VCRKEERSYSAHQEDAPTLIKGVEEKVRATYRSQVMLKTDCGYRGKKNRQNDRMREEEYNPSFKVEQRGRKRNGLFKDESHYNGRKEAVLRSCTARQ